MTIQTSETLTANNQDIRDLTYQQTIFCAALIGIFGGLVATAYDYGLEACLHVVWHTLPNVTTISTWSYLLIATTIGGFFVGLTLHFMGLPGEVAMVVDQIHDPGRIDIRQTPAMVIASLGTNGVIVCPDF